MHSKQVVTVNRVILISIVLQSGLWLHRCQGKTKKQGKGFSDKPHVIVILADDLGWNDVSFHGSTQIPTPNIDKLAADGITLNNYYVSPICTPTRGALLTGRHPMQLGLQRDVIVGGGPWGLGLNETILPQYLKDLGYATHAVGKWHLGFFAKELTPLYRGFDSFYGYYLGAEDYLDHTGWAEQGFWGLDFRDGLDLDLSANGSYSTELFTSRAEKLIKDHDPSTPLFLYLPQQAVHSGNPSSTGANPLEAPKKYTDRFPNIDDPNRKIFAGMVSALDDSVGNITQALDAKGMLDNCLIIFSTDNGGPAAGFDMNHANNWPLRGLKATYWEGGMRATGFVWSRLLNRPRRISHQLIHVTDWLPTIMHLAGANPGFNESELYGLNIWDALSNDLPSPRQELVHNYDKTSGAIRAGDYKLIIIGDDDGQFTKRFDGWYPPESCDIKSLNLTVKCAEVDPLLPRCDEFTSPCLYNVIADPCEFNNVALHHPDIVSDLRSRLLQFARTSQAPRICPTDADASPVFHGHAWVPWISLNVTIGDERQCKPPK